MNGNTNMIKFRKTLISETYNIHAIYNEDTCELKFVKHGVVIDQRDMTGYTDKQLEKYLQGIIDGLKT